MKNRSYIEVTEDMYSDIGIYDYYKQDDYANCSLSYVVDNSEDRCYSYENTVDIASKHQALKITHYLESDYYILGIKHRYYKYLSLLIKHRLGVIEIDKVGRIINFDKYIYFSKELASKNYTSVSTSNKQFLFSIKLSGQRPFTRRFEYYIAYYSHIKMVYLIPRKLYKKMQEIYRTIESQYYVNELAILLPEQIGDRRYNNHCNIEGNFLIGIIMNCNTKEEIINYVNIAIQMRKNEKILEKL